MSHLEYNSTSSNSSDHNNAKSILLTTQYIMTSIGSLANLVTFIVLQKGFSTFSPVNLFLLKSQAMIDLIICTCGTIMVLQTPMWTTGNYWFDSIVCHLWHGQFIYWTFVFTSIWNLVIIAYDRFLAICKPFVYGEFNKCKVLRFSSRYFQQVPLQQVEPCSKLICNTGIVLVNTLFQEWRVIISLSSMVLGYLSCITLDQQSSSAFSTEES